MKNHKLTILLIIMMKLVSCNWKGSELKFNKENNHLKDIELNTFDGKEHKLLYHWVTNNNEPIEYKVQTNILPDRIEYSQTHSNGARFHYHLFPNRLKKSYHLGYSDTTWIKYTDSLKLAIDDKSYQIYEFKELARKECIELEGDSTACETNLFFIKELGIMVDKNRMCISIDNKKSETLKKIFDKIVK